MQRHAFLVKQTAPNNSPHRVAQADMFIYASSSICDMFINSSVILHQSRTHFFLIIFVKISSKSILHSVNWLLEKLKFTYKIVLKCAIKWYYSLNQQTICCCENKKIKLTSSIEVEQKGQATNNKNNTNSTALSWCLFLHFMLQFECVFVPITIEFTCLFHFTFISVIPCKPMTILNVNLVMPFGEWLPHNCRFAWIVKIFLHSYANACITKFLFLIVNFGFWRYWWHQVIQHNQKTTVLPCCHHQSQSCSCRRAQER